MKKFPSSAHILGEAIKSNHTLGLNELHSLTFRIMKHYRDIYYPLKVNEFLSRHAFSEFPSETKAKIKKELLKPITINKKVYTNFMEESARRISQTFQPISGNLAELCVEKFIIDIGLKKNVHYTRKKNRTDFVFYYPDIKKNKKTHRIEVKNVKLRERGVRGLSFDGDSLLGFFNQSSEFSHATIKIIFEHCKKAGGYCYVPPTLLNQLRNKVSDKRFRSNEDFASDMSNFIKRGVI